MTLDVEIADFIRRLDAIGDSPVRLARADDVGDSADAASIAVNVSAPEKDRSFGGGGWLESGCTILVTARRYRRTTEIAEAINAALDGYSGQLAESRVIQSDMTGHAYVPQENGLFRSAANFAIMHV